MTQNSLISVIIPTYNREEFLIHAIESVINQKNSNWECIIIDDGSTDNTFKLVESYSLLDSRIKYFKRPVNSPKGANFCRNYGFELSKGEYVNWLDSDDILNEDKLLLQYEMLKENTILDFVVCQTLFFNSSIYDSKRLWNEKLSSDLPYKDFIMGNIGWSTNAPLWRKSFLTKKGYLFNPILQSSQDWEFHAKILLDGCNFKALNTILVYNRLGIKNRIGNSTKINRRYNRFLSSKIIYQILLRTNLIDIDLKNYIYNYQLDNYKKFLRNNEEISKEVKEELYKIKSGLCYRVKVVLIQLLFLGIYQLRLIKRFFNIKF